MSSNEHDFFFGSFCAREMREFIAPGNQNAVVTSDVQRDMNFRENPMTET